MNISYSKTFVKQAERLTPTQKQKAAKRIGLFKRDPMNKLLRNHALKGKYTGWRSIDIAGDLRLIYTEDQGKILFDQIGTHSQLYR